MSKYQVKIEDTVSSQSFTLDELLDYGLLDDYDEKIMVRAIGESRWVIARNYPFASKEQNCSSNNGFHINEDGTVTRKKSNATFSSGSSQKEYRIDEYGQVVRTVKPYNRAERTDVYQPAVSSSETATSSDDNNGCWWIIVFIIAGIILRAIFG